MNSKITKLIHLKIKITLRMYLISSRQISTHSILIAGAE